MRFAYASPWTGLLLAVCTGCGTTATIQRVNGPPIEAEIVGGDSEHVYVGTKESPETVNRSEIKDISHPGNGATIAGGILSGYGVVNIAVGVPMCSDKGTAFCVGVFTPLTIGLPILLWGIATHSSSVNAARTPLPEHNAGVFVTPMIGVEKGQPSGAAIVGTF